jgi:hypothetical protein
MPAKSFEHVATALSVSTFTQTSDPAEDEAPRQYHRNHAGSWTGWPLFSRGAMFDPAAMLWFQTMTAIWLSGKNARARLRFGGIIPARCGDLKGRMSLGVIPAK